MNVFYLGPKGTHSFLAASEWCRSSRVENAVLVPCPLLFQVVQSVHQSPGSFGILPLENVIEGPVTETLDLLYEHSPSVEIYEAFLQPVRHGLGVASGASFSASDLEVVYSHPQPLRQCARNLAHLAPKAGTVPCASTADAITRVKSLARPAGVLADPRALREAGFSLVTEDASDISNNRTRFAVIRLNDSASPPAEAEVSPVSRQNGFWVTSVVLNPRRDKRGLLYEILRRISSRHGLNLLSIHSRPDRAGGFLFFIDLEGRASDERVMRCLKSIEGYCREHTSRTAEIKLLGTYLSESFFPKPFASVLVLGGRGRMGKWFSRFFTRRGLSTDVHDLDVPDELSGKVARADVVLLSVPRAAIPGIVNQIAPLLRAGQLVVENCSLKADVLDALVEQVPAEVEVLGMHTMFGPKAARLEGETVMFVPTSKSGPQSEAFERLFYKEGAAVGVSGAEEHDRAVAFTQTLAHLALLSFADVITKSYSEADALRPFLTANSRCLVDLCERMTKQSDNLLWAVQTENPAARSVRDAFVQASSKVAEIIEAGDRDAFEKVIDRIRKLVTS